MNRFKETLLPIARIVNLTIIALIAVEIALWSYYNEATGVFAVVIAAIGVFDVIIVSGLTSLLGVLICLLRMADKKRTK